MNILIILLGCHVTSLLNDRVNTAINKVLALSEDYNQVSVNWYLSGGIKNPSESQITEAEKMKKQISEILINDHKYSTNQHTKFVIESNFILDTLATNTAENFVIANKFIQKNINTYAGVYVVTSDWHYKRAKYISDLAVPDNNFKWLLGSEEYSNFKQMEHIHMRNVPSDVNNALKKFAYADLTDL
jgi:uncharacterized SAM-binding protein YcdF (DUF218 family)